jgi:hypothetical protein
MNTLDQHLLLDNPPLRDVARSVREFVTIYGPADIYYHGQVHDRLEDMVYTFPGKILIERVLPQQGQMVVSLLDGFFSWLIEPMEPYSVEVVAKGAPPSSSPFVIEAEVHWPEWTAMFRPYIEARQLTSVASMLKRLGFRNPVDAPATGSIAPEFRSKSRRCGVYVLHFANGDYYVGQTIDITRRFPQHRARHGDISKVSFCPLGRRSLDLNEAQLIRLLETAGFSLRNIDMTNILPTEPGDFDDLMDAQQQQQWLTTLSFVDLEGPRPQPTKNDQLYSERFEDLMCLEWANDLLDIVRIYIHNGIPAILRGEAQYWQASVLPGSYTVLVRININWQEVFFATINEHGPCFYMIVSKRELQRAFGDDLAGLTYRYPDLEWEDSFYRSGGSDQVSLLIEGIDAVRLVLADPDVLPAIRVFNMRLMKRGKCPWARSHNFKLMNAILGIS